MLDLKNICKDYYVGNQRIPALKNLNISFRDKEFVSILGPSGCGKTTLLNIIGGLDKYTSGDLIINDRSTSKYNDRDWDTYRNHSIGFVFQSYNLIPHQTVLQNVELALSIGGISKKERRKRSIDALSQVGLADHINKKPNQMSGGQCQRVAIARAIVTNPDIIMADEPTGALDSQTSVQVLDLLKKIAKDKLVIMVTHNPELANKYSTRIIKMLDGEIISDSNPAKSKSKTDKKSLTKLRKSYMSLKEAIKLSGSNLLSKKKRTFITSLASSIGIIGISVILSVSSGMNAYVDELQRNSSSSNFISISNQSATIDIDSFDRNQGYEEFPDIDGIIAYNENKNHFIMTNQQLSEDYINYIDTNIIKDSKENSLVLDISYSYNMKLNILSKNINNYKFINSNNLTEIMDNSDYLSTQYDVLASIDKDNPFPTSYNEVVLVVDKYNRLNSDLLSQLGINGEDGELLNYDLLLNKEYKVIDNDHYYIKKLSNDYEIYSPITNTIDLENAYNNGQTIKIKSILRAKKDSSKEWISAGIGYTKQLTKQIHELNKNSKVVLAQLDNKEIDVLTGKKFMSGPSLLPIFSSSSLDSNLEKLGYKLTPTSMIIYPKDFDSKDEIVEILNNWNNSEIYKLYGNEKNEKDELIADKYKVNFTDFSELLVSMLSSLIDIITYTLIVFSSISLVVSSIMIAIITYASVIERIKEIGIIRSLGGRKKDVSNVFIAEACIIGLVSSVIALLITLGIDSIVNIILVKLVDVKDIAVLKPVTAIEMVLLSVGLNLLASLIPASIAAKKDPVVCLRTE